MSVFSGIGDFFRGAFGEDDQEKKRRKQREAQEAAARRQQAAQPRPQAQRPVQNQVDKPIPGLTQPKPQFAKIIQDKPTPTVEAPRVALPDQEFKGLQAESSKNKTVFGKDISGIMPGTSQDKVTSYNTNRVIKTNKDKYVAGFDKLDTDKKKVLVNSLTKQANISNDQAAIASLKALKDSGRLDGSNWDFVEGNADKLRGGTARAVLRGADFVLPGKNTFGLEKLADQLDESKNGLQQYSKKGKVGEKVGSAEKAIIDTYMLMKGTGAVSDAVEGSAGLKALDPLLNSSNKFARFFGGAIKEVPGSATGTAISALQTAGKGEKQNLKKDAAIGLGIDVLAPYASPALRKLFGKSGNQVDDVIQELNLEKYGDEASNLEKSIAERSQNIEQASKDLPDAEVPKTDRQAELEAIVNDEKEPAFRRKEAQTELEDLNRSATAPDGTDPLDRPAFQHQQDIQNVIDSETEKLTRYVNEHPELSKQQLEAAQEAAKERVVKLTDELKANRYGTEQVVANQAATTEEAAKAQQAVNATVAEDAAARTAPAPNQVVQDTPVAGSPEVAANDAYGTRQSTDEIINAGKPTFDEKGRLSAPQLLSPDRVIRENITRPLESKVNEGINALQTSENGVARGIGRLFNGFSTEAGVDPALQTAKMQMRGGIELGKLDNASINDLASTFSKEDLDNIYATIDKTRAAELGKVVDEASLTPEQAALRKKLVDIRDNTTVENLKRGLITEEQAANGEYLQRDYNFLYDKEGDVGKFEQGFKQELLGQYKGRKDVSEEAIQAAITDPAYLVAKKQAQSEAAWAMQDYGNFLASSGKVSDVPKPGFVQLPDTPLFGEARAKFVPQNISEDFTGFQYSNAMVSAFNDRITAYDRLGIRQAKKALLTVFNPAVRLGNQVTNRGIFSQLAGINPVQFNIAMESARNEIKAGGQLYREAVQQGLTGIDVTQADFFAKRVADSAEGDTGMVKKALDFVKTSYSNADDQARIAAYMVKRNQGYDPVEAARQVQRGFQDYKSVGFFYDMAAKTPIIGNAFVRFAADSVRIAKNAALDHPLRTAGTIAAWSAFVNGMSVLSGESTAGNEGDSMAKKAMNLVTGNNKSDAQKDRENRFGAPKLPFTDISTAVQTPYGEINVARFMPWYALNDVPGGNIASRVLPVGQSPLTIKDGKLAVNPQAMNDPLLGQIFQVGMDKDFRGKSIRDPKNNEADKFRRDPLSTEDQAKNVLRFLFNNNAPMGREIDQTVSAVKGVPDMYDKERSVPQAIARDFGFKVEQQGEKQAKDRASLQTYIEDNKQIEDELKSMSPDAQEAWKRINGYDKLRQEVPNEFKPGETRNKKAEVYDFAEDKWKDFAAHPELYKLMVDKKQREHARSIQEHAQDPTKPIKPVQPEFDPKLSESFRKQLIQNKMVAPGDDAELDQRMYSSPEWDYYNDLKDQYKKEATKYYPKSDKENFDDETVKNDDGQFPSKPPLLKSYSAQYKLYTDGKRDKPEWNDALTAQKEAYNKETLKWTNDARKKRGLPALTWDIWNNPTFGFDETPSTSGGFGFGFGGGGSRTPSVNTITNLTNFSDSVKRFEPVEAQAMPNVVALFQKLLAGEGGGKTKPKIGASARGQ